MQCEGFKPGCANVAIHCVNGYNFCTPCAQEFCGYTPVLTPLARARQLFSESAIPLDNLAREILVGLVAGAFRTVEQEAYKNAARHLNAAMEDVEHPRTPGVQPSLHLGIDDVRRLADELKLLPDE
jgi:hypothetical protein